MVCRTACPRGPGADFTNQTPSPEAGSPQAATQKWFCVLLMSPRPWQRLQSTELTHMKPQMPLVS